MEDEILEIEFELGNGTKHEMKVKEVDSSEWEEIEKGAKAIIVLVDNQKQLIVINTADYDGVSFKLLDNPNGMSYHYEEDYISRLFVEVK
tara:strand:+ start:1181 stop:1450 length:270 start_codon:yes stop_codon:yes gene_type:complete